VNRAARRAGWAAAALVPLVPLAFLFIRTPEATLSLKAAVAALLLVAVWRPWIGFAIAVTVMPVAPILSTIFTRSRTQPSAIVDIVALVAVAAWCRLRVMATGPGFSPWRAAGLLLAAAAMASVATQFLVYQSLGPATTWQALLEWLPAQPFESNPGHALYAAAPLVLGVALAIALDDFCRVDPSRVQQGARLIVAGGAAAALVNVLRFVQVITRADHPLSTLGAVIAEARVDALFNDVNATGPYLAMIVPMAMGLAVIEHRRRALWILSTVILGAAIWLTGSRSALGTAVLGGAAVSLVLGSKRARLVWLGALAVALVAAVVIAPQRMRAGTFEKGVLERVQYAQTSLRMFATAPVTGVGIGRYFDRSTEFAPPELRATWAEAAPRENAHNYYFQVLAELGLVGFIAFCAMIAWPFALKRREPVPPVLVVSVTAGVAAMLVAFLATHPLLVRPIGYLFFLALGLLATTRTAPVTRRPRLLAAAVMVAIAAIAAAVPYRAKAERNTANLENVTVGTSRWNPPLDGERHVSAGRTSRVFVDSQSKGAVLPLRLPRGGTPSREVSIYLNGKLANVVRVTPDAWTYAVLPLPEGQPRFRAVDFVVGGEIAPGDYPDALVFIGRFRTVERR
jgi:hypothetical protein